MLLPFDDCTLWFGDLQASCTVISSSENNINQRSKLGVHAFLQVLVFAVAQPGFIIIINRSDRCRG